MINFEFQKVIPFNEIQSVRRAKAVAVFPTAIEIIAGGKKVSVYFCTALVFNKTNIFYIYNLGYVIYVFFLCSTSLPLFYSVTKLISLSMKVGCTMALDLRKLQINR